MDKNKVVQNIFTDVKNDIKKIGIPVSENINPNIKLSKAKRRWGSCKISNIKGDYKYHISISEICFKEPNHIEFIKNTIAHELIHTICGCFNHGKIFKYYSNILENAGYKVKTATKSSLVKSDEEKIQEAKHILKCTVCGEMYYRFRFPKEKDYIRRIRCGKCSGKLEKIK